MAKTKKIIIGFGITLVSLLAYLSTIQGVIISVSPDITCEGSITNPCVSYFNITSSNYSLKFYNISNQKLIFSPDVKDYKLYRWTYGKWRETKFPINMTKGVKYIFKIEGIKHNPSDVIKWLVLAGDGSSPDPYWLAPSFASDSYTETTETHCINNTCQLTLYSGTMFAQNSSGSWVNASDILEITKSEDDLTFHYDGIEGYFNVTFETGVIYNKNYYSMSQVKSLYPIIQFDFPIKKYPANWKYAVNISNIPLNLSKIENITLTYKNHYGFTLDQLKSDKGRYIAKGIMNIVFDDLIDRNFDININKTENRIYISNITLDKFDDNSLYLDPTITLNESNGGNVGDAWVDKSSPTYNGGTSTITLRAGGVTSSILYNYFILWNLSIIPSGSTITIANMSLRQYTLSGATVLSAYNTSLYNSTGAGPWVEGTLTDAACGTRCDLTQNITWNNQPSISTLQDTKTVKVLTYWNVTNAAITTFANTTNKNMSIVILNASETHWYIFYSKEYATASVRPRLVITYTAGDSTAPTFTNPSINTTCAGKPVNISIVIQDETGLSGYIFSTNNTGTWINTTWSSLANGTVASNITTLNSTSGMVVNYTWYANDTSNNWATRVNSTTTTDCTYPLYSLNSTNSTSAGTPIEFRLYWQDETALSKAITELWNGSSWVNASTWCSLSSTTAWCNQTLVVNSTPQTLWWKQYANDTSNNWNTSQNFSLVTTSAGDTCDYSSGNWIIDCSENCIIDTATDVSGNDIIFDGTGTISVDADIYNFDDIFIESGCDIAVSAGKLFAG